MTLGTVAAPTFRSALRSRAFRRLVLSHGAGTVAQLVLTLAVGLEVLNRTSSGLWVSLSVALGFAPYVAFSGIAGTVADRWSRSVVLAWSAGIRVPCAVLTGIAFAADWDAAVLVALSAAAAVAATPAYPALAAAVPQCVAAGQLTSANALVTGVVNIAWMAGPGVLGLFVVAGAGAGAAVATCAALFLVAGVAALTARLPHPPRVAGSGWWRDALDGVKVLGAEPATRRPMASAIVDNFLYGYLVVAIVLLDRSEPAGPELLGWLNAALTTGALGSMFVVNRLATRSRQTAVLAWVMAGYAAAVALLGVVGPGLTGLLLLGLAGAGSLWAEVTAVTLLQRAAPGQVVARLFGVYDQLTVGAIAVGSFLAGPISGWLGAGPALTAVALVSLVTSVLVLGPPLPRSMLRSSVEQPP